jgi:hypothetical protein
VPEQLLVPLISLLQLRQAVSLLGDHQKMHWGLRVDVSERQRCVVLVNHISRYGL